MKAGRQIIEGETIRPLDLVTTKKKVEFFSEKFNVQKR